MDSDVILVVTQINQIHQINQNLLKLSEEAVVFVEDVRNDPSSENIILLISSLLSSLTLSSFTNVSRSSDRLLDCNIILRRRCFGCGI